MSRNVLFTWRAWVFLGLGLSACERAGEQPAPGNATMEETAPEPAQPDVDVKFDRRALLLAVVDAASATVLKQDDSARQRELDGKPFEVRIRFGCPIEVKPAKSAGGPFNIRFQPDTRTLRISAAPDLNLDSGAVAAIAGDQVEAVEGFWMYRPWLLADGCALAAPQPAAAPPKGGEAQDSGDAAPAPIESKPGQRVGLAQFFTETDSRTRRRHDRPYELTKVLGEKETPSANGYNLVLSGRLRALAGERVINCRPVAGLAPPECVVSAQFDRVWIEHPGNRSVLAEWAS